MPAPLDDPVTVLDEELGELLTGEMGVGDDSGARA
jgi:hypothetical protein